MLGWERAYLVFAAFAVMVWWTITLAVAYRKGTRAGFRHGIETGVRYILEQFFEGKLSMFNPTGGDEPRGSD